VLKDGRVKIVDFGIARIGTEAMTRTGQVMGTISYMSPEQVNGHVVDGRTDIFSAGVMLYQVLTYTLPFDTGDTASTLLRILHEPPPPLTTYLPNCAPKLQECVDRALAKDRDERYQTADDFAFDLLRIREDLKRQMSDQYIEEAQAAIARQEWARGKELLLEVMEVDTQNFAAKELLHQVQQALQKQQRVQQVRQLKTMADSAISHSMYRDALSYLEQATGLDKSNPDLFKLRQEVEAAAARQQKLQQALHRAELAQQSDELEEARAAAAEALEIDPHSTKAKTLHASVLKALADRTRQMQMQQILTEATREISSKHFTAALEVLQKAQALDGEAPEIVALVKAATAGKEQETRRRELQAAIAGIQESLDRQDGNQAFLNVEQALQRFPGDAALLKLKTIAEKQRETDERRRFLEEQMGEARKLLDAGHAGDALSVLEAALRKNPGDKRIQSLLAIVRENAEREHLEQQTREFVRRAKEALQAKQYDAAIDILEGVPAEIENSPDLLDLLQFAREEALAAARRQQIETSAQQAQQFIDQDEFDRAILLLESVLKDTSDEELELVLADARRRQQQHQSRIEAAITRGRRLLESGRADDAVKHLESQPPAFGRSPAFIEFLNTAKSEVARRRAVQQALAEARASLAANDFTSAAETLKVCSSTVGQSTEIQELLADVDAKHLAYSKRCVEKAISDARMLMMARQFPAALKILRSVANELDAVPDELRASFSKTEREAAEARDRLAKASRPGPAPQAGPAAQTAVEGSFEEPPPTTVPGVTAVPQPETRSLAVSPSAKGEEPIRNRTPIYVAVAAAVIVIAAAAVWYFTPARKTIAPAPNAYIAINAVPWGTVKSISSADGKVTLGAAAGQQTPVRIALPAGDYNVVIAGPNGSERTTPVKVTADSVAACNVVFEAIDVDKIIAEH
jgi:eukaryotic-like serine/threonine-protein kinase